MPGLRPGGVKARAIKSRPLDMPGMSIVPAKAVSDPELTHAEFRVLAALCVHTDKAGYCFPAGRTLGRNLGVTRQAVQRHIRRLVYLGYISKKSRKRKNGSDTSNGYRIHGWGQHDVAGVQGELARGATSEVAGRASSEVAPVTTHIKRPSLTLVDTQPDEVPKAFKLWNHLADELGLPKAQKLTKARIPKIKARLRDCGGLDGWCVALDKVRNAEWMRGKNERGWRVSLDFLLKESSFTKLLEGAYDNDETRNDQSHTKRHNQWDRKRAFLAGASRLNDR